MAFLLKSEPLILIYTHCSCKFQSSSSVKSPALFPWFRTCIGRLPLGSPPAWTSSPVSTRSMPSASHQRTYTSAFNYFGVPPLNIFQSTTACLGLGWEEKGRWCPNLDTIFQVCSDECQLKGELNTSISVLSDTAQDATANFHCCQGMLQEGVFLAYWTCHKFAHILLIFDEKFDSSMQTGCTCFLTCL